MQHEAHEGKVAAAMQVDAMLQEVAKTPEGSTAMFVNFYCTDPARLEAMKADPVQTLISPFEEKYDENTVAHIRERIDGCKIHLLQNSEDHWHVVLPPRADKAVGVPDDYLEKISGGEIFATMFGITLATTTYIGGGAMYTVGIGLIAVAAGSIAITTAAVAVGITVGSLAAAGRL